MTDAEYESDELVEPRDNSFEAFFERYKRDYPGEWEAYETNKERERKLPFEALVDSSLAYFLKGYRRPIPYIWWSKAGYTMTRKQFAQAKRRDSIKRRRIRRAAKKGWTTR